VTAALITLASVKDWLGSSGMQPMPSSSDALLSRLIAMASSFAITYLQRPVVPATFTETYNGQDTTQLTLRQQPVILVRSLTVGTTSVPARTQPNSYGFVNDSAGVYIDGWGLSWSGGRFDRGIQNIAVSYDAGYQTSDAVSIPSGMPFTLTSDSLSRPWNADRGVAYATGAAFTLVTTAPTLAGTYQITSDGQGNAVYNFAAGDAGASVVVTYGFTPEDIAAALIELVGERYRSKDRIGETSVGIQQQTTAFSQKDMNAFAKAALQQYRQVVPVQ
jgi:hypothetical protein